MREKKGIVKVDAFFALNFWLHLAYTLQQNRNSPSKIHRAITKVHFLVYVPTGCLKSGMSLDVI